MAGRIQKLGIAIGTKGVGKTFTTTQLIQQYLYGNPAKGVPGRKVLILDINDEYEQINSIPLNYVAAFAAHPTIEARRIRPYNTDGTNMTLDQFAQALFFTLHNFKGGMLLLEDINKYISDNMPNDLIGAICTNRHSDMDIIIHFQSIGRISPKLWQNLNYIRFHKITDSVARHKNKFEDKVEMFTIAEFIVNEQYRINPRYYLYIDVDDEKIRGNINSQMIEKALDDYISNDYSKLISPLLKRVDFSSGKNVKYNQQTAIKSVKDKLREKYF